MPASTTWAGRPDSVIRTVRSSSSPSTRVSPARCSKRLRFRVPEASRTAPDSIAVTRPIGTKIRRRATTSTTRPSTRGAAMPTRSATTTSRTLPTRSPLGSKTVSPASLETYALVTVVTNRKATVGPVAGPDFLEYEVVDVFAPRAYAGNPLAVVFDADGLSTEQCQALANEFHLSETSFLSAPTEPGADYRVRIFTPFAELPFAGHPSVGAAHTLVRTGRLSAGTLRQECGVGVLDLLVDEDGATLTGGSPSIGHARAPEAVASAMGLVGRRRRRGAGAHGRLRPAVHLPRRPRGRRRPGDPRQGRARRARGGGGRVGALLGRRHRRPRTPASSPATCTGTRTRPPARPPWAPGSGWSGPGCSAPTGRRPTSSGRARRWAGRRC